MHVCKFASGGLQRNLTYLPEMPECQRKCFSGAIVEFSKSQGHRKCFGCSCEKRYEAMHVCEGMLDGLKEAPNLPLKRPKCQRKCFSGPIKQPYDWNVLKMAARGGSSTVPSTFTCVGHVAFTRAIKQASPAARPKMEPIIIVRTTRHGSSSWWSYGSLSGTRSPLDYAPGTHMTPFMSCLA